MGVQAQEFEGISTNIPGVYTKSEFPPSLGGVAANTNIVAILGVAKGGIPYNAAGVDDDKKVNLITSVGQATSLLRGGDGFYMTEFYLSPTKDPALNRPSNVLFFGVNPSSQATSVITDGSNDQINLTTTRYGAFANQLSYKVEAATNLGHKITVRRAGVNIAEEDDVGFEYLDIQYVGAGTAATMSITGAALTTVVTGGPGGEDLNLLFTDFPKLSDLVAYINEQSGYDCVLKGRGNDLTTTFDAVTTQDIRTAVYTAVAHVEAAIQFFNLRSGGEITAEWDGGTPRADIANNANFVFFTGGSDGVATNTDWANALELIKKFKINHVLAATGDPVLHAMVDQHVNEMSGIEEKKNRSAGFGSALAKTLDARIAESKAVNSPRSEYWMTPFTRPDVLNDNAAREFEPFFLAAMGAGIRFGNDVTISATFKSLNITAVSESYTRDQKKAAIDAGGSIVGQDDAGFTVIHNVTTFQSANLILNLPSMLRTADAITLDSQAKLQRRIAALKKAPTALVIKDMQNYIITNLLPFYRDSVGWLTDDPINEDPAFSDVEFALKGDRFDFSFTGIIPAPLHFVFVKQKFVVTGQVQ